MIKMIEKYKVEILVAILVLAAFSLQACTQPAETEADLPQASSTPGKTSTSTPRPKAPTRIPTKTAISNTQTATPAPTRTPKPVIFTVSGGNLNVRRGPDLAYNYVGVLYDGDVAIAVGRDRIGNWVQIELPSNPGVKGWVSTETDYSTIEGEIRSLPLVKVEAPSPAFIRNCTKHTILVQPVNVELLNKYSGLDNVEHFDVLTYQIYDLDVAGTPRLEDVALSEGRTVDIIYDGAGEKSKCE